MLRSFRACAFLAIVCSLTCSGFAQQTQPTTAASSDDVTKWMKQLGDEDWKVRDAAQRSLIAAGDGALEPVKGLATQSSDPEVRQRADEVVRRLTAARAAREADERRRNRPAEERLKATLVTLKVDKAPVREVYESLAKQADAPPLLPRGGGGDADRFWAQHGNKTVTVDLSNVAFWKALDELTPQTGLTLDDFGHNLALVPVQQRGAFGGGDLVSYDGAFRVIAESHGMAGSFHSLKVYVEPKLRVLSYAMEVDVDEVEAALRGQRVPGAAVPRPGRMPARMPRNRSDRPHTGGPVFDVTLPMDILGEPIAYLKGSVRAKVAMREEALEIDDILHANNIKRELSGRRIVLNVMEAEPGDYLVTLVAFAGPAPASPISQVSPKMLDDAGRELTSPGVGSGVSDTRSEFHFSFRQPPGVGPAAKLILTFPAETREIRIPFEFGQPPAKP